MTTLELHLISAKDLNVYFSDNMDVFATVALVDSNDVHSQRSTTKVIRNCRTNPTFNSTLRFTIPDSLSHDPLSSLDISLIRSRPLPWPFAGFHVRLADLIDEHNNGMESITSCQVWGIYGTPNRGELSFSYKFGDKVVEAPAKEVQPVTSYSCCPKITTALVEIVNPSKEHAEIAMLAVLLVTSAVCLFLLIFISNTLLV